MMPLLIDIARLMLWLVILAAVFVPLERLFAEERRPWLRPRLWQDLGFYFLSGLLPALLLAAPMAALAAFTGRLLPDSYHAWIAGLPLWARLAASFVIGEIGFYWAHRWTHEVPFLWRFHRLHHAPDRLDWLVNTRTHPVDLIFVRLCGLAPLYALGLADAASPGGNMVSVAVLLVATIWGFLIHADLRWRFGWLEQALASPFFHHWHHSAVAPINRNYASMLPLMDRLFGTLHLPKQGWPAAYGVAEESAPVSGAAVREPSHN